MAYLLPVLRDEDVRLLYPPVTVFESLQMGALPGTLLTPSLVFFCLNDRLSSLSKSSKSYSNARPRPPSGSHLDKLLPFSISILATPITPLPSIVPDCSFFAPLSSSPAPPSCSPTLPQYPPFEVVLNHASASLKSMNCGQTLPACLSLNRGKLHKGVLIACIIDYGLSRSASNIG